MNDWTRRWALFKADVAPLHPFVKVEDFIHSTHVSLRYKYFYAETPKAGCSTIKKLLIRAEYGAKTEFEEMEYIHFREFSPLLNVRQAGNVRQFLARKDVFKFCFVRNPYTRLLSGYLDKIKGDTFQKRPVMLQLGYGDSVERDLSFGEFVDAVCDTPVMYMDQHWRVQYYQTYQEGIKYDLIGKFERFNADLHKALEATGIDYQQYFEEERPHATNAGRNVRDYYTDALAEKVCRKYRIDFEYFGYGKELPE